MFLTLVLSQLYPPLQSVNIAFGGFFLGLTFYGAGILAKCHVRSQTADATGEHDLRVGVDANEAAGEEAVGGYRGKNRIINGAAIGTVMQLLALYGGFGLVGIVLAVPILVTGVYARNHPPKPLPPPPPASEQHAYKSYMTRLRTRKTWEKVDNVAWGLSMILVEAAVIAAFLLFGFRFPTAPR